MHVISSYYCWLSTSDCKSHLMDQVGSGAEIDRVVFFPFSVSWEEGIMAVDWLGFASGQELQEES